MHTAAEVRRQGYGQQERQTVAQRCFLIHQTFVTDVVGSVTKITQSDLSTYSNFKTGSALFHVNSAPYGNFKTRNC